ncbi:NADP oxidoreductase coenzyme F420-dependent [Trueperella bernardiae]|uniref:NADP oxidoreductase coenzyme F420-dependent n=2 Tax=Trueperella bernardiae TaxID=59561 RepID=A0A0W1KIS1_9ACTO|nr:NAD(P)-binding domain-containing protein [Trueperella bernardiae]KTF03583.1 NADP oxidoreductase coenzyme F420-dependent [Trueperella bernardiae]
MEEFRRGAIIIGAGLMGISLAERFFEIGTTPWVAARRPATELAATLGAQARAIDVVDIKNLPAKAPIFLAVPLSALETIPAEALDGRLAIDVGNYWPRLDAASRFAREPRASSLITQELFPAARVVKTLNHLAYSDLAFDARPHSTDYRRGQCVAADDAEARLAAARIVDALGFAPVDAGPLANGRLFGPGTQVFNGGWRTAEQLARIVRRLGDYPAEPFALD